MTSPEQLSQALDEALAAIESGEAVAAVLARQPALAEELAPLLAVAQAAGAGQPPARVPRQAQAASRAQFLAQAGRLRGAAALPLASRRPARWLGLARAAFVAVLVGAGFVAVSFTAVAVSAESLPGDPLYSIKRAAEDTQLLLTTDTESRQRLETTFDERRAQEVQSLGEQGRLVQVDFTGRLQVLPVDAGLWVVGGISVQLSPEAQVVGSPVVGDRLRIIGVVQADRTVVAKQVWVLVSRPRTATDDPSAAATTSPAATADPAPSATSAASSVPPSPAPSATEDLISPSQTATGSATDDHGGNDESETPEATDDDGGNHGTETPEATDDHGGGGGPSPSNTPQPTHGGGGGPSPSNTPQPTGGGGGPSPSNTPQPTGGGGGPSPSNTPRPTDDDYGGGGSPSETPKPDDDDDDGSGSQAPSPTPTASPT